MSSGITASSPPGISTPAASFASALAALPLLAVVDRGSLWPWAAYRAGLALVLLRESRP